MEKPLGIIAGSGQLPLVVAEAYKTRNGGDVFIAKLHGATTYDLSLYHNEEFAIGQVGKIFEYFRLHNIKDVVMVGGIKRPNFTGLKVDSLGTKLLGRVIKAKILGDDKLLRIIAQFCEENDFNIRSAASILSGEATISLGSITQKHPSKEDFKNISIGFAAAKALGAKDLGQAVVVSAGLVVAEEDAEGTDAMIKSVIKSSASVLVKAMKPQQDDRLDIPAIGLDTVENIAANGFAGIAIEADKVIVIDRENVIKRADELGIFIVGVDK